MQYVVLRVRAEEERKMREWLSGGVSPCQGEGRGFESRLALFIIHWEVRQIQDFLFFVLKYLRTPFCPPEYLSINITQNAFSAKALTAISQSKSSVSPHTIMTLESMEKGEYFYGQSYSINEYYPPVASGHSYDSFAAMGRALRCLQSAGTGNHISMSRSPFLCDRR